MTVGLGLSLLAGVVVTVLILCCLASRNRRRERWDFRQGFTDHYSHLRKQKGGIAGNAALVAALQQSFANQTSYVTNTFDQGETQTLDIE